MALISAARGAVDARSWSSSPVYLASRAMLTRQNGQRILAIAASAAVAIPPSEVDSISMYGQNSAAFIHAREMMAQHVERERRRHARADERHRAREPVGGELPLPRALVVERRGAAVQPPLGAAAGARRFPRRRAPGDQRALRRHRRAASSPPRRRSCAPTARAAGFIVITLDAETYLERARDDLPRDHADPARDPRSSRSA